MKFYWKASDIPELAHLPPSVRKQVWKTALRKALFHWTTLTAWVVLFLLGRFVVAPLLGLDEAIGSGIGAAAGAMLAWQVAVSDVRKGTEATRRAQDIWFIRSVVIAGIVLFGGIVWLVSVASVPSGPAAEARLEVDMSSSQVEVRDAHYVVHGTIVNKGTAAGSTSLLKVAFQHGDAELGSRTYPLKLGPIAPGQQLDFTQQLDEPPADTTDMTPSVDSVTETSGGSRMDAMASFAPRLMRWWCRGERNADQRIRVCTAVIQSGRESPENMAMAFSNRGIAYRHKGQYDRAVEDYDQALRLEPDFAAALTNRGIAYDQMYRYDRAIHDYDQAIRLTPDDAAAFNGRCYAKASAGRLDEALADCNESLRLRPGSADILDSRAFTDLKMERFQESIADFDAALKISPQMASALFGRGLARRHLADFTAGDADIAAALKIDPEIRAKYARRGVTR